MKVQINPVPYRVGNGTFLEVKELSGNPPVNVRWSITTNTGTEVETGESTISQEQWDNWPAGNDNNYIERVVAALLGVSLVE